ncbi:MAG: archaeal heat shock protein Hsp14 [Halobacteriota archaeon]
MRRSNPFSDIEELFERMSRQFDDVSQQWDSGMMRQAMQGMAIDVTDHDDEFVVTADLPGFEKEDIDLTIDGRTLTISATREMESEESSGEYLRHERRQDSVRRSVQLPEEVDETEAGAKYTNGVLTVTLPKLAPSEEDTRHIDID